MNNEKTQQVLNLLNATELNWSVEKKPLYAFSESGEKISTDSYGIMRGDKHLGTVGKQYVPFQNAEMAETIIEATEALGIATTRGGSLADDRKVFLQAELAEMQIGNSGIRRWITCTNSHDGTSSIGFGSTNTVIVCQNTFHRANKELSKFRHTRTAKERIELAISEMRATLLLDNKVMDSFKRMADTKLDEPIVQQLLQSVFGVTADTKREDISGRKNNQILEFNKSLLTSIDEQGQTVWALFNGITRYTNHFAAPKDGKLNYLMNGGGYKTNNIAYEFLNDYIEKHKPVVHTAGLN